MKQVIHRKCPNCVWYQVRAEDDTTFMYTPCEFHAPQTHAFLSRRLKKVDVRIVDVDDK